MTDTADTRVAEVWTYGGVRIGSKRKKVHAWRDAKGEDMYFGKLTGHAIGGRYQVMVQRDPAGAFQSVTIGARFLGGRCEDEHLVSQWQTEDRLTEAKLARDRAERKLAAEPDALELAIQPLRDLRARSCRTWADRVAFTAMVLEALGQ
jgi:hypothetical protein